MAVRVKLNDGVEVVVHHLGIDEMRQLYAEALNGKDLLEVKGSNGKAWVVNPNQVVYFEEVDEAVSEGLDPDHQDRQPAAPAR